MNAPSYADLEQENSTLRQRVDELEHQLANHTRILEQLRISETALQESQQMLRIVIDNLPEAVFWKDQNLHYLGCNHSFAASAGLADPNDILGKTDFDLPWRHLAEQYRADDAEILVSNTSRYHFEEPIYEHGVEGWARTSKIPLHNQRGETIALLGIYENITAQKQIEQALRLARFSLDRAVIPIFWSDMDGRISYANNAACTTLGYTQAELLALNILDIDRSVPYKVARTIWQQLREHLTFAIESVHTRKDGSQFPVDVAGNYISFAGQEYIVSFARDISERKRDEESRLALQEQVIAAQRAVLRELSTPLLPIARGVVVMPVIGTIDSTRAQQLMETLLDGVARHQASYAIIDITGVKVVDTQVANALISAAQAAHLLGAHVLLTGISPEVAQTLVHLTVDLHRIIPQSTLQSGIAYALGRHQR